MTIEWRTDWWIVIRIKKLDEVDEILEAYKTARRQDPSYIFYIWAGLYFLLQILTSLISCLLLLTWKESAGLMSRLVLWKFIRKQLMPTLHGKLREFELTRPGRWEIIQKWISVFKQSSLQLLCCLHLLLHTTLHENLQHTDSLNVLNVKLGQEAYP